MKKITKIISIAVSSALALSMGIAIAFEWPQKNTSTSSFMSYFGQFRGSIIETSMVYSKLDEVCAINSGNVVMQMEEHDDEMGWFESTLGSSLIIAHDNDIYTVYSNLNPETVIAAKDGAVPVIQGSILGKSGNSGWNQDSGLEFQILDFLNKTALNPKIILPRIGRERRLETGTVYLEDRLGHIFNLEELESIPSDSYRIYKTRQLSAVPFQTSVAVNGVTVDSIFYDAIKEEEGRIIAVGLKDNYFTDILYPDEEKQFLATASLYKGKNVITITLTDALGFSRTSNFHVTAY